MLMTVRKNSWLLLVLVLIAAVSVTACSLGKQERTKGDQVKFLIGVSQANLVEPWRIAMNEEIKEEIAKHKDVRVIFADAAQDDIKQITDIKKMLQEGIDLLIVSPNDAAALTLTVKEVYKNIPVIVLDRAVEGYDYTLYIGPDNKMIGKKAGQYIVELLGDNGGSVIEIQGLSGSPPVRDRSEGFREIMNRHAEIKIVDTVNGDWLRDKAQDKIKEVLREHPTVDVIFAQNDPMAYGAYLAAQELNLGGIKFVGIDGLVGQTGGIELVKKGILTGTFTCSVGGKEAVRYALDILNHEMGIPKKIILRSAQITQDNVNRYVTEITSYAKEETASKKTITVGFSQVGTESEWRIANTNSIITAAREAGIHLIYKNANGSQQAQIDSVREFISQKVDAIVLSPVVATGWDEVLVEAKAAGIPVLLSNRFVNVKDETLYVTWIGSDFIEQGKRAAKWLVGYMRDRKGNINIAEIRGISDAASATGRKIGFEEIIKEYPNFLIVRSEQGDFTKETGKKVMSELLKQQDCKIDVLFAHDDDMAIGAIEAIEEYGLKPGKDIIIVSVDAARSAFQAMIDGKLNCTVENNPLYGPQVMKAIKDLVAGKELPVRNYSSENVFPAEVAAKEFPKRRY